MLKPIVQGIMVYWLVCFFVGSFVLFAFGDRGFDRFYDIAFRKIPVIAVCLGIPIWIAYSVHVVLLR